MFWRLTDEVVIRWYTDIPTHTYRWWKNCRNFMNLCGKQVSILLFYYWFAISNWFFNFGKTLLHHFWRFVLFQLFSKLFALSHFDTTTKATTDTVTALQSDISWQTMEDPQLHLSNKLRQNIRMTKKHHGMSYKLMIVKLN